MDQQKHAISANSSCPANKEQLEEQDRDDNDDDNCHQLNAAPAYFDAGLVEMTVVGTHHIASTRNNDFTNRSQKASIFVRMRQLQAWQGACVLSPCQGAGLL